MSPNTEDNEARERARKGQLKFVKSKESLLDRYGSHIAIGVFVAIILFAVWSKLSRSTPNVDVVDINDQNYIDTLNAEGRSFRVGHVAMWEGLKLVDAKRTINSQATNRNQLYRCGSGQKDTILPPSYDFRVAHADCIQPVFTQGNCSSSYAIAAVSAITNRWCKNQGPTSPKLSPQPAIACDKFINAQCRSGYVSRVLDYAKLYGLVE